MQDEETRQEQYSPLVQCFAVAAKGGWSNNCLKEASLQLQFDLVRVNTKLVWSMSSLFQWFL